LIPLQSYFVTKEERHNFEGTPIGLSMKSVMAGYARVFSVVFFLGGLGAANTLVNPQEVVDPAKITTYKTTIIFGIFAIPTFFAANIRSLKFADYSTACQLAHKLQFSRRLQLYIEYHYGKITEEEAQTELDALPAEAPEAAPGVLMSAEEQELAELYQRYAPT